jgi:hypothetical protein
MAIEYRDGHVYYYKYARKNGRVKRQYVAHGDFAELLAWDDQEQRREHEEERRPRQEADQAHREAYHAERKRGQAIRTLLLIGLEAVGFTRYDRHPWRRRIMAALPSPVPMAGDEFKSKFRTLARSVFRGDQSAVEKLRKLAKAYPIQTAKELTFDIARTARLGLAVTEFSQRFAADSLIAKMETLIVELAGDNPSPAKRLCAEAVGFAWGEHWILCMAAASGGVGKRSLEDIRRRTAAHKRLLSGLKTLTQIERAEQKPRRMVDVTWRPRISSNEG